MRDGNGKREIDSAVNPFTKKGDDKVNQQNFIRDVVCGMYLITTEGCKVSEVIGEKYYFCCVTCKKVFDNNPTIYADKEEGYFDPNNPNDFLDGRFRIL